MLHLGHLAVPAQRALPARPKAVVQHALHDHGAGGVVGARFRAKTEEADPLGIDAVAVDQTHDGRGRHGIDALRGAAHSEAVADDRPGLIPRVTGPLTPRLEVDAIRRDVNGKAAETNLLGHRTPGNSPNAPIPHALGRHGAALYDKCLGITCLESARNQK